MTGIFDDRYFIREMAGKKYIIKAGQGFNEYIPPAALSDTAVFFLYTMSNSYEKGCFIKYLDDILDEVCAGFNNKPPRDMVKDDLIQLIKTLVRWDRGFAEIEGSLH